jgi:hypothetical protein
MEMGRMTKKADGEPNRGPATSARRSAAKKDCEEHREKLLDSALEESFPASDPPSIPHTPC